jgi:hypothetical protein
MKSTQFKSILAINVVTLLILFVVWWINGRDETWMYVFAAMISLSSFIFILPQKKS